MKFSTNQKVKTEIKELLRLTIPLSSAQVAQAATGFVDTVMMGWLGQETLAAGGLAATTFTTLIVTSSGIVVGISPFIAEAYGANNRGRIQQLTRQGLWLSLIVAIPIMLLLKNMAQIMQQLGQSPEVVTIATQYLDVMVWAFLPALTFAMFKSVISSLSQARPITMIVVCGTLFNIIGNYILGFGKLGFPVMGLGGIAWASTLAQWGMLLFIVLYILSDHRLKAYQLFHKLLQFEPKVIKELLGIGLPISLSFAFEAGLFTITTFLMGILGTQVLAAHQIVFQTIALIFMVPLGMSFATTIRVGQWQGQQNFKGVQRAAYVSMSMGAIFMTIMAVVITIYPQQIIALYLDVGNPKNAQVVTLAVAMFKIAAISQILDGVQTTAAGALRGLKDTRIPMLLSFLAFWGIGLVIGYLSGFTLGLGGVGLWLGQFTGVAVSAGFFLWRFRRLISASENLLPK